MTIPTPHRRRLPNRRPSLTRTINAGNHRFEVTVGIDPVDGQPREVFLDGTKDGGELAVILDDASVLISVALQHSIGAAVLAKSMSHVPLAPLTSADLAEAAGPRQTAPASIIGVVLDLLSSFETGPSRTQENASSRATKNGPKQRHE